MQMSNMDSYNFAELHLHSLSVEKKGNDVGIHC